MSKKCLIWMSGPRCTFGIIKDNETELVLEAAPLAKKFIGQNWKKCFTWFRQKWGITDIVYMGEK